MLLKQDVLSRAQAMEKILRRMGRFDEKGGSWTDFCTRHKFHHSNVSLYKSGKVLPRWETLYALDSALEKDGF